MGFQALSLCFFGSFLGATLLLETRLVNSNEVVQIQMGVALCCAEAGVPEQSLDFWEFGSSLE